MTERVKRIFEVKPKGAGWAIHLRSSNGRSISESPAYRSKPQAVTAAEREAERYNRGKAPTVARVEVKDRAS